MGPQGLGQQLRTLAAPEGIQVWLAVLHSGLQPPIIPVPGDPCLDLGLSRHQAYMQSVHMHIYRQMLIHIK